MANPDGSMDGWPSIRRKAVAVGPLWKTGGGTSVGPLPGGGTCPSDWPPAQDTQPYGVKTLLQHEPDWRSWRRLWSQRPPQSRYQLHPYDFERHIIMVSSARIPIADRHCSVALYWYRLTIQEGTARQITKMHSSRSFGDEVHKQLVTHRVLMSAHSPIYYVCDINNHLFDCVFMAQSILYFLVANYPILIT